MHAGDAGIADAIKEAVTFSDNVWTFNNSWGTRPVGRYSTTIRTAFAKAYKNNRVSCVAMGNHHTGLPNADDVPSFPASCNSGLIAVGATDINDGVAGFSARGQNIDVSAPGVNITSTNFNNGYINIDGTSMATPHVAGLASLLKGFNTNLANDDIEQIIRLTADDANGANFPGFDNQMGEGRINAERALQSLQAPNQLLHLNTTGSSIFSTTGNQRRVFLGVPFLPDAAYIVQRSEVRTNVTFPPMCSIVGIWGRGVGTTGYREEFGRNFGEGICEIVPGTLTSTGCTLRTWIYEVASINGQYLGFYPASAQNVVMQYTILGVPLPTTIVGTNPICSTETFSLNAPVPSGATINWSVPRNAVGISPTTGSQTTITNTHNGVFTLTATINSSCPLNNPYTITRTLTAGPLLPFIEGPFDPVQHTIMGTAYSGQQYYFLASEYAPESPAPTYTWTLTPPAGSGGSTYLFSGHQIYITFNDGEGDYVLDLAKTTSCGTNHTIMTIHVQAGYGFRLSASPNPTSDVLQVTIDNEIPQVKALKQDEDISIDLIDFNTGIKRKGWSFKNVQNTFNLSVGCVPKGQYIIKLKKGKYKQTKQIIVN